MGKKDISVSFLKMVSAGEVDEAYNKYVHPDFIHHNPYFKGDRQSFVDGMKDNAREFPDKNYETIHALEEGNMVAVHGKVALSKELVYALFHLFRFEGDMIIEEWEASQELLEDSVNENGQF